LLANYNEDRSASFYCTATTLMSREVIEAALKEAQRQMGPARAADPDIKTRARIVRTAIQECATAAGIDL